MDGEIAKRSRRMSADDIVQARIDAETKRKAAEALAAMGLSLSDAIRLLLMRVADEKRLPFDPNPPNAASVAAMQELIAGEGERFAGGEALFKDLGL
jgi:DNA-damage-inducible protein J